MRLFRLVVKLSARKGKLCYVYQVSGVFEVSLKTASGVVRSREEGKSKIEVAKSKVSLVLRQGNLS